jgi:predicted Zn-dependent protease
MSSQRVFTVKPGSKQEAIKDAQKRLGGHKTLTADQLKKKPNEPTGPSPSRALRYNCITELKRDGIASIVVGLDNEIPRWAPGSTVNYATYADGYPTENDAIYAANALIAAADEWNAIDFGVKFKWVADLDEAAFVLQYGGDQGTTLASAYFPNTNALNTVSVYSYAFDKSPQTSDRGTFKNYEIMQNVFVHELGHVLGLRHEFAIEQEGAGAIRLFSTDPESVMSYNFPPQIQESDKTDVKKFYDLPASRVDDVIPDN